MPWSTAPAREPTCCASIDPGGNRARFVSFRRVRILCASLLVAVLAAACGSGVDARGAASEATPETDVEHAWRELGPFTERGADANVRTRDGMVTLWHPSGGMAGEGRFEDGVKEGPWRFWHENGSLRWEGTFDGGVPVGAERAWYDNGQIHFEGELEDGRRQGVYRYWYENGQLELEAQFEDDLRDGRCRRWTRDGALDPIATGIYSDGRKVRDL